MRLEVRKLSSLKPHEEVFRDEVKELKDMLLASGVQKKPLIVDANTGVILDGAHRYSAMLEIGLKYAVVYAVDYNQPEIAVKRWIPCAERADLAFLKAVENFDLIMVEHRAAISSVDKQQAPFALLTKEAGYLSTNRVASTLEAYWSGWHLFQRLASTLHFSPDLDINETLNRFALILYRRTLDKKDVISSALAGKLYPPKSTRHILPFEPKEICFRLSYLRGD